MLISVSGGKIHRLSGSGMREMAFRSAPTMCGLNVTPQNYFQDEESANRHTGGRLSASLCKRCSTGVSHSE